jgi:hypothetical protein
MVLVAAAAQEGLVLTELLQQEGMEEQDCSIQ